MWTTTKARLLGLPDLVTRAALAEARIDPDIARRATAAGAWCEVLPGAWLRSDRAHTRRDRQEAALALLGDGALLTGADACSAHQLRDVPPDVRVTVLVRAGLQRDLGPTVRLLRTTDLPAGLVVGGLPVAPPVRAVLDAARCCPVLRDVRALVLAAVADGWCGVDDLRGSLDSGPRRGSALCRRAIADAALGAASAPEAEVVDALRTARGAGSFVLNQPVWLGDRFVGTPDGWLLGTAVGWEVDSRRHHGAADDLDATLLRHDRFAAAGLDLVHVTPRRLRNDPGAFVAVLLARVADRHARGSSAPPDLRVGPRGAGRAAAAWS